MSVMKLGCLGVRVGVASLHGGCSLFNSSKRSLASSQGSHRKDEPNVTVRAESSLGAHEDADEEALRWRKTYQLTGHGIRNRCSMHTDDGFDIATDIPKSMGGGNTAPQPVLLLLSALAGCETATANFVARHLKMRLKGISFELEAWRDQRGAIGMPISPDIDGTDGIPSMIQVVTGTATVDTDGTQEQVDSLAHEVHKRCPVASMMAASGCKLEIKWIKAVPAS